MLIWKDFESFAIKKFHFTTEVLLNSLQKQKRAWN